MGKRINVKAGDIFSIEVAEKEYIFGRVIFDPNEQYMKKVPKEEQFSYLDFFSGCVLIETYTGIFPFIEKVDFSKIAVKSSFVSNKIFKREDVKILHNIAINHKEVSFPEVISTMNSNHYFTVGELKIPINISSQEHDEIHVYPSYGSGYWEVVATIVWSGRKDLVEESDIKDTYFKAEDLRDNHNCEVRNKIYSMIGEDPTQSYYEMALKYGFDLARLY
jgi:hypothetical protein